ncbi:MAG: phage antirepressor KilAC domain-containing protein [Porphyromonadaceae bacterium]|nr:phage antirepressor KilAC domain-containing protein [Porphyromonadaceae bacterium]
MDLELFEMKKTTITKPSGEIIVSVTPKVTGKGQVYFVNKFLKQKELV